MPLTESVDVVRAEGASLLEATDQVDAVVDACTAALRPHMLRVRGRDRPLAARLEHLPSAVALSRLHYGADVTISEVAPEQEEFIIALPVAGRARFGYGGTTALLEPGVMSVVSPISAVHSGDRTRLRPGPGAPGPQAGRERRGRAHRYRRRHGRAFELATTQVSAGLLGLIDAAARIATDTRIDRRTRLAGQLEAVITDALLLSYPSNLSSRLAGSEECVSAGRVARAMEDYMLANLQDQVPLSVVAQHCGVTLRSLQLGFRREVGMSPGEWLRK